MKHPELVKKLRALPAQRMAVQNLDNALSLLTPEERLIANLLLIYPAENNVQQVCEKLHLEQAAVYRRRRQVLEKLEAALTGT